MKRYNYQFILVAFFLLMPYLGQGAIAYVIATAVILYKLNELTKLNKSFVIFCVIAVGIYAIKSLSPNSLVLIRYWQVYFGFIIFYLFFYVNSSSIPIDKIALLISAAVIVEAILINTVVPPTAMLNIPVHDGILVEGHLTNYFGFYQRPYGPAANPSMTGTVLAILYLLATKRSTKWLAFTAVVLSGSTTGYLLLIIAYFMANPLHIRTIFYSIVIGLAAFIFSGGDEYFSYRISPSYLLTIAEYTFEQFIDHLKPDDFSILIGSNYLVDGEPIFQTDNGWAPFFFTNGLILSVIYLLTPYWRGAFPKKAPFIIFLIGAIHYPAVFSLPGQVIFALLLSNKIALGSQEDAEPKKNKITTLDIDANPA